MAYMTPDRVFAVALAKLVGLTEEDIKDARRLEVHCNAGELATVTVERFILRDDVDYEAVTTRYRVLPVED